MYVMLTSFLVELSCLSPDFSDEGNRPRVTIEENGGQYVVSWTVEVARYPGCVEQVFSYAPLRYNVYRINTDGVTVLQTVLSCVMAMCG